MGPTAVSGVLVIHFIPNAAHCEGVIAETKNGWRQQLTMLVRDTIAIPFPPFWTWSPPVWCVIFAVVTMLVSVASGQ
jgi:hypothetical protein